MPEKALTGSFPAARVLGAVTVLEAAAFFLGAAAHTGAPIPLGFAVLAEPAILPAVIVEGLCGLLLALAGYALLTGKTWSGRAAKGAQAMAMGGVLLGMCALALGMGPRTPVNDVYHSAMLIVLGVMLILLTSRDGVHKKRKVSGPAAFSK